ncbi:MAG TPA: helix-turn-helix domain-containing protein [Solirubrobacteraceae bacterium]|jgi:hypothetical protein|nr:helix-turn-helix domain-containing protein [Solirubrobacteraceae bacterium]
MDSLAADASAIVMDTPPPPSAAAGPQSSARRHLWMHLSKMGAYAGWERDAEQALCHRHTLRYRIRRVEQLSGRDLPNPRDRIEFWLAPRARELAL